MVAFALLISLTLLAVPHLHSKQRTRRKRENKVVSVMRNEENMREFQCSEPKPELHYFGKALLYIQTEQYLMHYCF